jgi:hypothetical protein
MMAQPPARPPTRSLAGDPPPDPPLEPPARPARHAPAPGFRDRYRHLAAGELESWLRMNRASFGWSAIGYEEEIERLTVEYLRGVGWTPEVASAWRDVADAVQEAGLDAWRRTTGSVPGATPAT